ncbi:MAG: MoxR family ATPase [Hyphomicrobium aestuarii]|nr:MoxR family ATPase [Hyphomicrobium aestuarii]
MLVPSSPAEVQQRLGEAAYIADETLATALSLAQTLSRPLLIEGEAGVGKTFIATALAKATGRRLIRLQCYEGLDAGHAIYEWNYQRQILAIATTQAAGSTLSDARLFSEEFLLKRPLLEAISQDTPPILLIDEIDRADEEFEAYLLEVLADHQITIPELGTIAAKSIPLTLLTSNGTRELSDALRRRCLFHYIDYPDFATELRIVQAQVPQCSLVLASQIVGFVQGLRQQDLKKMPGIAETLDWTAALVGLDVGGITDDPEAVHRSLLCVLKTREDRDAVPLAVFQRLAGRAA